MLAQQMLFHVRKLEVRALCKSTLVSELGRALPGRKHQLRIHCALALSCPIAGDRLHGPARASSQQRTLRAQSSVELDKPEPFMEYCSFVNQYRAQWCSLIKDVLQDLQKLQSSSANDSAVEDEFQQLLTDAERALSKCGRRLPGRMKDLMLHARVLSISKPGQVCQCSLHSQKPSMLAAGLSEDLSWDFIATCCLTQTHLAGAYGLHSILQGGELDVA